MRVSSRKELTLPPENPNNRGLGLSPRTSGVTGIDLMSDLRQVPVLAVVDHDAGHREPVARALSAFYRVVEYTDADQALRGIGGDPVDLILVDELAAPAGGPAFILAARQRRALADIPIILTSRREDENLGMVVRHCRATIGLSRPYRRSTLLKTVTTLLNARVEARWESLPPLQRSALRGTLDVFNSLAEIIETGSTLDYAEMKTACEPLIEVIAVNDFRALLNGVKSHDNYTFAHSLKVATMLCLFGHSMGLKRHEQLVLACGGLLHDTGKMMIPNEVLNKPGRLDAAEWQVMRSHVPVTLEFLQAGDHVPRGAMMIAAQHHEKMDGSGYPNGLKGAELHELARMAAIVDVFSALTDRRAYKPAMAAEKAFEIMTKDMVGHLDQHLLRMFRQIVLDSAPDL